MSEQTTEQDWRNVARAMGFDLVGCVYDCPHFQDCECGAWMIRLGPIQRCNGSESFRPDSNYNDLARLIKAMQGAFGIVRHHCVDGSTGATVDMFAKADGTILVDAIQVAEYRAPTDIEATWPAIVLALRAQEKSDANKT